MTVADPAGPAAQHSRFLSLYALAFAGGAVAYVPFLTLLLPLQATAISGDDPGRALTLIAHCTFAGALTASFANIGFGWISDALRVRRPLIALGMIGSSALMVTMPLATGPGELILRIIGWQLCLNAMLAPLAAWAGDAVPDAQKGLLGGLLAFAPALGALAGVVVTADPLDPARWGTTIVAILVLAMVTPGLVAARARAMPHLATSAPAASGPRDPAPSGPRAVIGMWLARLLVQIAEASLFAFLLLWLRSLAPGFPAHRTAQIFMTVLCAAVIVALALGRWSDRTGRPLAPLAGLAALCAAGLGMMALATTLPMAIAAYALFGLASTVFLSLHASQTLRVLPSARHRGRDLGLFNLTNTMPSLVMPWLTLALVPLYGFAALFLVLALLTASAVLLLVVLGRGPGQAGRRA